MSAPPRRIVQAVELLELRATDAVLEVGCGRGHALALMAEVVTRGRLLGIDRSLLQVKSARALNRAAIAAGRLKIEQLALDEASTSVDERFGKVIAINVNAFWTSPERALTSAARLLRPSGTLCLFYEVPGAARARSLATTLPKLLSAHGFVAAWQRLDGVNYAVSAKRSK
jgi:SAM-dependent methyltransferase